MNYRLNLDLIRAIAVILVVLYHAKIPGFEYGYIGVDIFFVLSGFLITSNIIISCMNDRFSVGKFYEGRVRRILPPLYIVLIASSIVAYLMMLPSQLKVYGQALISTIFFTSNLYFYKTINYWSEAVDFNPLIHTWSLSIEEQYYLIIPLLFFLLKSNLLYVFLSIVVLFILSVGFLASSDDLMQAETFYLIQYRFWQFSVGSIFAFLHYKLGFHLISSKVVWPVFISFIILVVYWNTSNLSPLFLQWMAVFFVLLIAFSRDFVRWENNKLLTTLRAIGLSSYPAYLIHQPLLSFSRIYLKKSDIDIYFSFILVISNFCLAYLFYVYIEKPLRYKILLSGKVLYIFCLLLAFCLLVVGFKLHYSEGMIAAKTASMDENSKTIFNKIEESKLERSVHWKEVLSNSNRAYESDKSIKILVIGDSLSEDFYVSSQYIDLGSGFEIRHSYFDDECFKNFDTHSNEINYNGELCADSANKLFSSSLYRESNVIVVVAGWLENAKYLNYLSRFPRLSNKEVYVVASHGFSDVSSILFELISAESYDIKSLSFDRDTYFNYRTSVANRILNEISESHNYKLLSTPDFFCDAFSGRCSLFDIDGSPLVIDQAHLSRLGAIKFSLWLKNNFYKDLGGPL